MGNLRNIIKKTLNEAAGISFEVRTWAKIIEEHVSNEIKEFQAKEKANQPVAEKPPVSQGPREVDPVLGFTHFEYLTDFDNITDTAYIYGDDLTLTPDVREDYPGIERELSGKMFKVYLSGDGEFEVEPARGTYISSDDYLFGIKELVEDHAVEGGIFYDLEYKFLSATQGGMGDGPGEDDENFGWGDIDFSDFMRNRGGDSGRWNYGNWARWSAPKLPEKIIIEGTQYPEAYENFKVDKWVITNSGRIEYDHWKSGYDEDRNYVVYLNMPMGSIGGSMLVHEIKHAYDDWNRISKGYPAIRDSWEIKNIYTKDFEKLVLGGSFKLHNMLHPIIRYYYLGSKLESPAYLENEYDNASFTNYRDVAKKLMNFKASNFINKKGEPAKGLQESWTNLLIDYNIPFFRKYPNVLDFIRVTEKYFNKRGRDILRRIDKMRYVHNKPAKRYSYSSGTNKPNNKKKNDDLPY